MSLGSNYRRLDGRNEDLVVRGRKTFGEVRGKRGTKGRPSKLIIIVEQTCIPNCSLGSTWSSKVPERFYLISFSPLGKTTTHFESLFFTPRHLTGQRLGDLFRQTCFL